VVRWMTRSIVGVAANSPDDVFEGFGTGRCVSAPVQVVVVDDEVPLVHLVTRYLEREGYEVHPAHDGKLGDDPDDARYVRTVRGVGYRMGKP